MTPSRTSDCCTCDWGCDAGEQTTTYEECVTHSRTLRCLCGHYRSEHAQGGRCHGAYGTLAADADDDVSVEVHCPCDNYYPVEDGWHQVRT